MSRRLKMLALAGFATLLLSLPAFSQTMTIEGIVKDPDGKPIPNATIIFDRTDIKGTYQVKTDKKGHYGHYGLPLGTFDVSVHVDNQIRDLVKGVRGKVGDPVNLNFNLKAEQEGVGPSAENQKAMTKEEKEAFDKQTKAREAQLAKNKELNDAYTAENALDQKQYDAAIENLTKGAAIDDKQVAIWSSLAEAYVGAAGQKPSEASGLYDKAFDAYKKALELKPDDAAYYNNYALALAKDKKIDEAKVNLDKAAQLDPPGAGKYFYNMGALLVNSGQSEAAGEEFKKAITADPTYADAQYQYGVYLTAKATTDAKTGKILPVPGTVEALQKYIDLKGAACGSVDASSTSAPPGCENVIAAKAMISQLGGTVSTTFANPKATANEQKKKK